LSIFWISFGLGLQIIAKLWNLVGLGLKFKNRIGSGLQNITVRSSLLSIRDEHRTGLGLEWIRNITNSVDFGLGLNCKMLQKVRFRTRIGLN